MIVSTTRFGTLDIQDEQVIQFEKGVPGFPESIRFVMIDLEQYRPFLFMQSIEDPDLMFILVDPYSYFPGYPDAETIAAEVGWPTEEKERLLVRVIATIQGNGEITVNLIAPILIHTRLNIGEQAILQSVKGLETRHPLVMKPAAELEVHP
jgi:flagellar assembly factor FliW